MPYTGTLTLPKWTKLDQLLPTVPWLWASDCDEGPRAAWELEYVPDHERASCWPIPIYEKDGATTAFLVLHATRGDGNDGGRITLRISHSARYDLYAREAIAVAQAPKRHPYRTDADWWREEGA